MADAILSSLGAGQSVAFIAGNSPRTVMSNLRGGAVITYRYRYAGAISSTTSLSSIPAGAIRLGSVTT